jgi:glucose-fructose oxidoreductase
MSNATSRPPLKVVGINFDHMHMGDLLRQCHEHAQVEIVGVADEDLGRVAPIADRFNIPAERRYEDLRRCLDETRPDLALLCPMTGRHGEYVEAVAPYGVNILSKSRWPPASPTRSMIAAVEKTGKTMVINWPSPGTRRTSRPSA